VRIGGFLVLCVLLAAPAPARAAPRDDARVAAQEALKLYNLGRFAAAAAAYTRAYELLPDPRLLFNIAQAHRQAGNHVRAIHFYRAYLRELPRAANRAEVEQRIHDLTELMAGEVVRERADAGLPEATPAAPDAAVAAPPAAPADAAVVVRIPPPLPPEPSPSPPPPIDLTRRSTPLYKRWWVWAGAAAVVAVGVVVAVSLSGGDGAPDTDWGTERAFE